MTPQLAAKLTMHEPNGAPLRFRGGRRPEQGGSLIPLPVRRAAFVRSFHGSPLRRAARQIR